MDLSSSQQRDSKYTGCHRRFLLKFILLKILKYLEREISGDVLQSEVFLLYDGYTVPTIYYIDLYSWCMYISYLCITYFNTHAWCFSFTDLLFSIKCCDQIRLHNYKFENILFYSVCTKTSTNACGCI